MSVDSFESLVRAVLASSVSKVWAVAVDEWQIVDLEEDISGAGICICGQQNLVKLFTIENQLSGAELFPIGSVCVNKFGRADLDRDVDLLSGLHALRKAILEIGEIPLTSEHFSRAMLEDFFFHDVFTPDQWNRGDGENDYEFLVKMFNKRNKDEITTRQHYKIHMLLHQKVFPAVLADDRLR